jgi:hypothetical protein
MSLYPLLVLIFAPLVSMAYPDFISYGYKSCLTCHFSGHGGGPLNDYGRALFASEFTSTQFTKKSPDELAEQSGFIGATELPWWIRPGIKYRGLYYKADVGNSKASSRWINMQGDLDIVLNFDPENKLSFISSFNYIPAPKRPGSTYDSKPSEFISKQHYARWLIRKNWVGYLGLFDKIFGIRHADHTAVNRSVIGLGQQDQAHGVAVQYLNEKIDTSFQYFIGNLNQEKDLRQIGFSATGEYFFRNFFSLGLSALDSENNFKKESRFAIHSRVPFSKGKSFLFELGLYENKTKTLVEKNNKGYYSFIQGLIGLSKGYNFLTTYQLYKPELNLSTSLETSRLGLGFLIFPWARTEFRFELINVRTVAAENTSPDQWNLQNQVHVSW